MSKRDEHHIYVHHVDKDQKCCTICGKPYHGPGLDHASCVVKEGPGKMIESGIGWLSYLLGGGRHDKDK